MSPLDLGNAAQKTTGRDSQLPDADDDRAASHHVTVMRPTFQGVMQAGAGVLDPAASRPATKPDAPVARRHVGFQYIKQLVLTGGPFLLIDLVLLAAILLAAKEVVLFLGWSPAMNLSGSVVPIAVGFIVIAAELGLYPGIRLSPVDEFRRAAVTVTSVFAVWFAVVAFLSDGELVWQRCSYVAIAYAMYLLALPACRSAGRSMLARCSWWGFPTLVCGNDVAAVKVHDWLADNRRLGLRPVGVIADRDELEIDGDEPWYAGTWTEADEAASRTGAYWAVVVASDTNSSAFPVRLAEHLRTFPHIHILSELTGLPDDWGSRQQPEGLSGIHLQQNLMLPLPRLTKRLMDIVGSMAAGLILLPLLFYIAVAVKLSSRGPILYGHERLGKDGRRFRAWKFRTMFENSSDVLEYYLEQHPELRLEWEQDHKLRHDPRVTRIGRFIRKTSLDELPQLWNVFRGEMSLVGPRPIVTAEIEKYGPYYGLYTMVTPGITGLWQVSGRNNTTYEERIQLDVYYVRNWSPWMDLYLLFRTIRIVLFAHGAY